MNWHDITDARPYWAPDFGALFGVRPWEMNDLAPDELDAMFRYLNEARKHGK